MKLTKHTDYAFRVLIYLAGMREEQTTITHITNLYGISKTHLMKIVNELVNLGWVKSTRGKHGGIKLNVSPEEINLRDVITSMEKTLAPVNCSEPKCYIDSVCVLKPILFDAQEHYLEYLAAYNLGDLINKRVIKILN